VIPSVYVVLLHYPVTNRNGVVVTTSVTNMDIHDISRASRTYGAKGYFIVTPIEDQHELVGRILKHWGTEASRTYHPDRAEAVAVARLMHSFAEVKAAIREECGEEPEVVLTDARPLKDSTSYASYRKELESDGRTKPVALVFGTGWGIAEEFYPEVHRILKPIYGRKTEDEKGYNHLSVRSAVSIILDRLFGN
jgi:hypothetical protein